MKTDIIFPQFSVCSLNHITYKPWYFICNAILVNNNGASRIIRFQSIIYYSPSPKVFFILTASGLGALPQLWHCMEGRFHHVFERWHSIERRQGVIPNPPWWIECCIIVTEQITKPHPPFWSIVVAYGGSIQTEKNGYLMKNVYATIPWEAI